MTETLTEERTSTIEKVRAFLYREARLLDDRDFDAWIECYDPSASYWMPAWDDNGELTEDPQREISLIYYDNRGGIEDRVFRIKTDRSSATSLPEPRTGHNITDVEILEQNGDEVKVRFNWFNLYFRYNVTETHFGYSLYTINMAGEQPKIMDKKVVLKNDYIHHVVDIYMI